MNTIKQIYLLLKAEAFDMARSSTDLLTAVYFAIIGLLIFHIAVGSSKIDDSYFMAFFYTMQIFSSMLSIQFLLERDVKTGFISKLITSGFDIYAICIAKYIFFILYAISIFLICIIASTILYGISLDLAVQSLYIYTAYVPAYCAIIMLLNILTMFCSNKIGLFIVSFPFISPLLMLLILASQEFYYIYILLGLALIYFGLLLLFFRHLTLCIMR